MLNNTIIFFFSTVLFYFSNYSFFSSFSLFQVFDLKYYISDMNTSQENFQSILAYAVRRHDLSVMSS